FPRQSTSDAKMWAVTKSQMRIGRSRDIEIVGIGKNRRISIGRCQREINHLPFADLFPAKFEIVRDYSINNGNSPIESKELLHRCLEKLRAFPEPAQLRRVRKERMHGVS